MAFRYSQIPVPLQGRCKGLARHFGVEGGKGSWRRRGVDSESWSPYYGSVGMKFGDTRTRSNRTHSPGSFLSISLSAEIYSTASAQVIALTF